MARDPSKYVFDLSERGVWDRDLPNVRLGDLAELLETASWMHRMHEVVYEIRWPQTADGIILPSSGDLEFETQFKQLTGFYPKEKSHYRKLYTVEESENGRVVRPVLISRPATRGTYETFGPDGPGLECEKEWIEIDDRGTDPSIKSVEPDDERAVRLSRNEDIKEFNKRALPVQKLPTEPRMDKWVWLMRPFLEWCLWYSREWFRENVDPSAKLVIAPRNNNYPDDEKLKKYSSCAKLAYHLAIFSDHRYHSNNLHSVLHPKKKQKGWVRYYDI